MYSKDTKYNVKYVTKDGKEETKQITPEEDMSKPQMIMKLKEEDKNFFKLIENVEYITPEELKKLHKDYKSTVGDIIRFSKYRGQDPEKVRQKYKDLGYDETDPMIVTSDGKGGTILKPVKVKKEENKMSKTLFDYLEEHSFEGVDIRDTVYDMTCWFEFTLEDADSDPFDMFMSKLAKSLHIDFEDVNKTVVVDLTNWVTKNYDKLEEIFDLSGEDKESNIEEIVGSIMPGLLSGYTTNSVYKELADNMIVESKEVVEENEDEFEELENLDEEVTDVEEEKEETLDESIKPEEDNGDYNYFYSPRQIIEICEDKKYEHTFDEEFGTIEELEKELQGIKIIESEKPITTIEEPLTDRYPGWKNCKVKTILKDGREFVSEEDTLSVWSAVQLVVADEVMKESRKPLSEEVEKEETLDEAIKRAHEEEISAINTYDTVLSKTDESTDAKLMEMINEIKKDEEDHKTLLQHYIETGEVWTDEDLEKEDEENVEVEESKECIKEELPKQAPLDSLLDMVTEATNITELEEIADSVLDSELKEDLLECIDDEDAKAYGEDIYFNTVKLNMQNIIEDYMDEK